MPAYLERRELDRPRERARALIAAVLLQTVLAIALFRGLQVEFGRRSEVAERLIAVTLAPTPPPVEPPPVRSKAAVERTPLHAASVTPREPKPVRAPPAVVPVVAVQSSPAPLPGGSASGSANGAASGGNGEGRGGGAGGRTELEQIAGEITPRDYPRHLGNAGIGGRVGVSFTVGVNGRVTRCAVTHSSGVPELDALTCRLIEQRFRYRPSTDRFGRPIPDEVEGEHEWSADRG